MPLFKSICRFAIQPNVNALKLLRASKRLGDSTIKVDLFGEYRFVLSSPVDIARIWHYAHEREVIASFLFMLQPDDILWDIGAAVGLYSIHAGENVKHVTAFEPDPAAFARLEKHIHMNGMTNRIESSPFALSDEVGTFDLFSDGLDGMAPSLGDNQRHGNSTTIQTTTIDQLIADGKPTPTFLKIDVEGAEDRLLRGGSKLLHSNDRPRVIFIEVHPKWIPNFGGSAETLENYLAEVGYRRMVKRDRAGEYHGIYVADNAL